MELIISETRRERDWYYCDRCYLSKTGDVINAKIRGDCLVDPEKIRSMRLEIQARLPINQKGNYRIEPDEITKALWNDWQRRQSMGKAENNN